MPVFIALTALVFSSKLDDCFNLPKFIWVLGCTVFCGCLLIFTAYRQGKISFLKSPLYLPLLLYIAWQIFCLVPAVNRYAGLAHIGVFTTCALFYFLFLLFVSSDKDILKILRLVVYVSAFVALYGILQNFGIDFVRWEIRNSALSTLGRRNFAGEYLVMVIPYAFFLIRNSTTGRERTLFSGISLLLIAHLFFTYTRASWIGFAASCAVVAFFFGRLKTTKMTAVRAAIVLFFILVTVSFAGILKFESGSFRSRSLIWKTAAIMIAKNPVWGVGTGNFEMAYPLYSIGRKDALLPLTERVANAHNEFLEAAAETGIVGLFLLCFFLFRVFAMSVAVIRKGARNDRVIAVFITASLAGILVNSLASFPLHNVATLFYFFVNCGIITLLYDKLHPVPRRNLRVVWKGIPFVVLTVASGFVVFAVCCLLASYDISMSKKCMRSALAKQSSVYWFLAEVYGRDAVSLNPFSIEGHFQLGKVYLVANYLDKADEQFLKALRLHPNSDVILNNLGTINQRLKRFETAEKYYLQSYKLNPQRPETLNNLGSICLESGRVDDSINWFRKAIELSPDFVEANFNLAQAYFEKKDFQNARLMWEKTLSIRPGFVPAQERLKEISTQESSKR